MKNFSFKESLPLLVRLTPLVALDNMPGKPLAIEIPVGRQHYPDLLLLGIEP